MPECRSRVGPVTVTSIDASPRSMVVMAGVSLSHWPVSQTSTTSALSSWPYSARNAGSEGEPHSSSPSIITDTEIGSLPATAFQARTASKKVISWPLLSSAPRATITCPLAASEMMIGSNGGERPQVDRVGRLHVVVAVEQHVRRARCALVLVVGDDHRMPRGRHDARVEPEVAQLVGAPVGRLLAARLVGRVGRDAFDTQQLEQPRQRRIARIVQRRQHLV